MLRPTAVFYEGLIVGGAPRALPGVFPVTRASQPHAEEGWFAAGPAPAVAPPIAAENVGTDLRQDPGRLGKDVDVACARHLGRRAGRGGRRAGCEGRPRLVA